MFRRPLLALALSVCAGIGPLACGTDGAQGQAGSEGGQSAEDASGIGDPTAAFDGSGANLTADSHSGDSALSGDASDGAAHDATVLNPATDAGAPRADGGYPVGWLYTRNNTIYVSDGTAAGKPWMGRGVNIDDIFMCGYNNTLYVTAPDKTLETEIAGLMSAWKPTFVRISLSMDSYPTVASWLTNAPQYKTPMTSVINAIGANANVHVLVTLRSDASMILQATGDPEPTGIPSDRSTTPNASLYPTGTDATYVALVDTFANSSFVMFGLTNEPGGNLRSDATIAAAMSHAVGTIRAEEDRLGVPHHIVSVQGSSYTSSAGFYSTNPIAMDNVVYEVHGYPPPVGSYTYANIAVIIGEYGSLTSATAPAFFADIEAKQIPNLAWDFDPYSNCAPDLLNVTQSASSLTPTPWGTIVQNYLLAH